MKKKLLRHFKLYCVLNYTSAGKKDIVSLAKKAILGGADVIQLRFKNAKLSRVINDACRIRRLTKKSNTLFLINDRIDVAFLSAADGVHLGQEDIPLPLARKLLGKEKIIGLSTHCLRQALLAQQQGADYISVGPVFSTPTKPEYEAVGTALVKKAANKIKIPFLAIGGINQNNLNEVLRAGATRIAIVRAVCRAKDVQEAVAEFKQRLNNNRIL